MVQIQFLDKNIVGALVPVYTMKPERVVFLYDARVIKEQRRKEVMEAARLRQEKLSIEYVEVDMHRMEDVRYELQQVVNKYKSKGVQIDITGGSEIMTACGVMLGREHKLSVIYADFYSGYMLNVEDAARICKLADVRLEEYLTAIGGKYMYSASNTPTEPEFERIIECAKFIFANETKWDKFNRHLQDKKYSAKGEMEFSLDEKAEDEDCRLMLQKFLDEGYARKIGPDRYRYASGKAKEYMTVSGIWLELFIYVQAKKCYENVYMGVNIDWNKRDICKSRDNEIDVVIMKGSQPIFISCKMRKVHREMVYEIYAMARRLAGDHAKSLLATTDDVRENRDKDTSIYLRMTKMKVGLIQDGDFDDESAKDVFINALKMTE